MNLRVFEKLHGPVLHPGREMKETIERQAFSRPFSVVSFQ
jgi:hypothetical protein